MTAALKKIPSEESLRHLRIPLCDWPSNLDIKQTRIDRVYKLPTAGKNIRFRGLDDDSDQGGEEVREEAGEGDSYGGINEGGDGAGGEEGAEEREWEGIEDSENEDERSPFDDDEPWEGIED